MYIYFFVFWKKAFFKKGKCSAPIPLPSPCKQDKDCVNCSLCHQSWPENRNAADSSCYSFDTPDTCLTFRRQLTPQLVCVWPEGGGEGGSSSGEHLVSMDKPSFFYHSTVSCLKSLYSALITFIRIFCLWVKISERGTVNEFQPCFVKLHGCKTGAGKKKLFQSSYLADECNVYWNWEKVLTHKFFCFLFTLSLFEKHFWLRMVQTTWRFTKCLILYKAIHGSRICVKKQWVLITNGTWRVFLLT